MRQWWIRAAVLVASGLPGATAVPLVPRQESSGGSSGVAPQVWIPVVVVVVVLFCAFLFFWRRTGIMNPLRGVASLVASRATQAVNSTATGVREVTASQLTGRTANACSRTMRPLRAARRTQRTPSQMSTTSLPVYMKEPGDQELVIFRGPEEMDASDAIAEAREAEDQEDEHEGGSDAGGGGGLHDGAYHSVPMTSMPASAQSLSFVAAERQAPETENTDTSTTDLIPRRSETRSSQDTSDSRSLLMQRTSDVPSEAPPDYEAEQRYSTTVIVPPGLADTLEPPETPPLLASPHPPSSSPESASNGRRHSRLVSRVSNILHLRNGSSSSSASRARAATTSDSPTPALTSNVADVGSMPNTNTVDSTITLNDTPPHTSSTSTNPAPPHGRHRSSQSGGSSSTLNLMLPFRTISRQRSVTSLHNNGSAANLSSPSALSLSLAAGAISAPLSHTLVRTEIRFPRGGPTPEQIKLISSRDTLGRFGVPYGRDAVEHAQHSRLELALDPPPEFESPTDGAGPSAARGEGDGGDGGDGAGEGEGDDPDALPSGGDAPTPSSLERHTSASGSAALVEPPPILLPLFM